MSALFEALGLWGNLGAFSVGAALILVVGGKLERWAERIAQVTQLGDVFAGMILLAVSTSLPEIATSITAAVRGEVGLAVNNLLGGVIVQTMVLAFADVVCERSALTGRVPSFGLLLQGVGLTLILATTAIVATVETRWRGVGWVADAGPAAIGAVYLFMQYVTMRSRERPRWVPTEGGSKSDADGAAESGAKASEDQRSILFRLLIVYGLGSLLVCAGGFVVVLATEQIAAQTGASQSFLGFTLVAFATSLPEVATTLAAGRRGHGITAASNIFGSNSFDVALLALVAAIAEGPLFAGELAPSVFAASLGVVLTGIYLVGMLERRDGTILRMGWDSALVLVLGFGGIGVMFALGTK